MGRDALLGFPWESLHSGRIGLIWQLFVAGKVQIHVWLQSSIAGGYLIIGGSAEGMHIWENMHLIEVLVGSLQEAS